MTHMPPNHQCCLSPPSMKLLNEMRSEDLGCFKISPPLGIKSSASLGQLQGTRECLILSVSSHPPQFLCSAMRSTLGGRGGQCLVRYVTSVPSLAPVTLLWAVQSLLQPSASLFLLGVLFPSPSKSLHRARGLKGRVG